MEHQLADLVVMLLLCITILTILIILGVKSMSTLSDAVNGAAEAVQTLNDTVTKTVALIENNSNPTNVFTQADVDAANGVSAAIKAANNSLAAVVPGATSL